MSRSAPAKKKTPKTATRSETLKQKVNSIRALQDNIDEQIAALAPGIKGATGFFSDDPELGGLQQQKKALEDEKAKLQLQEAKLLRGFLTGGQGDVKTATDDELRRIAGQGR